MPPPSTPPPHPTPTLNPHLHPHLAYLVCRYSKHRTAVVVSILLLLRLLTASTVAYTPAVSGPTMRLMYRTGIIPLCWWVWSSFGVCLGWFLRLAGVRLRAKWGMSEGGAWGGNCVQEMMPPRYFLAVLVCKRGGMWFVCVAGRGLWPHNTADVQDRQHPPLLVGVVGFFG
jgi:hypothetical protein